MKYFDDTVLNKLKSGDRDAFTWIYNKYYLQLCFHAGKIINNGDIAEDIVQNLFTKIWESRETMDVKISLKSYLYSSVRNFCLKHLEHIKVIQKYGNHLLHVNENNEFLIRDNNDPLAILISKERLREIENAIEALPVQCKKVIMLRIEGLSYQEIAKKIGVSTSAVGVQINRAKEKLQIHL